MASGDPRDQQYGKPYTGTPVQQTSREGKVATVLDMYANKARTITMHVADNHYIASDGHLYHEQALMKCYLCSMPIFERWHGSVWTKVGAVHDYCHYDNFMVSLQRNLRRDRISVP